MVTFTKIEVEILLQSIRGLHVNGPVSEVAKMYSTQIMPLEQKLEAMKAELSADTKKETEPQTEEARHARKK